MSSLTGTVKIYGTNLYSGCGHEAVKSFDSCPRCRIAELEAFCEQFINAYPDWRDKYELLGDEDE